MAAHDSGSAADGALTRPWESHDFGRTVHRMPRRVARPSTVEEVAELVRGARGEGIGVAARGRGHGMNGHGLVEDGLLIDLGDLDDIGAVEPDRVRVGAGATWHQVLAATTAHGLTPPALTDYLHTSVGGTLSVGGVGGMALHHGMQTDNVLALEVVTGTGELVTCSPTRDRELFDTARAGIGQVGIIVRATVRLVPAFNHAKWFHLAYTDTAAMIAGQRTLLAAGTPSFLQALGAFDDTGTFIWSIDAVFFTDVPEDVTPDILGDVHATEITSDTLPYSAFADRVAPVMELRHQSGDYWAPHPWLNLYLPDAIVDAELPAVLAELTPQNMGSTGALLTYPIPTGKVTTPGIRLPEAGTAWLIAVLHSDVDKQTDGLATWERRNRDIYDRLRRSGATQYPISPPTFTAAEWREHYGTHWDTLAAVKDRTDPDRILTPGTGMWN
ncbi:hypothetical protein CFN78_08245 [Amycolatopsis antarctica]|uniref:FAD-binding PCMH-type domain-containing protein n=1 Tax=Amycolatopsis antarctica TaxID=1854586 RepID=A0A263D7Z9_9PSEU|nr:FAD-binding protein [Amycolatopsis antarctica]OZM73525.1 hypothetical protein CFN78_08245 [Amycolatopsis antarctica]